MTHETMKAIEADIFKGYREKAVARFNEYMPEGMKIEDTWEGVMNAVDYALDHADRKGERSGAVLAAAMWTHGFLEEDTYCRINKMTEIVDAEVAAAKEQETVPTTTATPAPTPSVK